MGKTIGYMLTCSTYGTWLPGDERGYVEHGRVSGMNEGLYNKSINCLKQKKIELNDKQREIVKKAIREEAERLGHMVYTIAVDRDHVHVVLGYAPIAVSEVVARCKNTARMALKKEGFSGRLWARGYDKRYCFDEEALVARVEYVERHGDG